MRWCLGYMKREEQLEFLKRAKAALDNKPKHYSRTKGPPSYIIVFDNIDDDIEREKPLEVYGQTIQTIKYYEELFAEAGLEIHRQERKQTLKKYFAVKMWALFEN